MRCHTIRGGKNPVYGVTIPKEIVPFCKEVFYSIQKSGTTLILTSGCKVEYSKEDIREYNYEDVDTS